MEQWRTGTPPNETNVEVEHQGEMIVVQAIHGRVGMLPHWTDGVGHLWPWNFFTRWRPVSALRFIVELDDGCWLAAGEGDPARTLVKENARRFGTPLEAIKALQAARKYRPFRRAEVCREDRSKVFDQ